MSEHKYINSPIMKMFKGSHDGLLQRRFDLSAIELPETVMIGDIVSLSLTIRVVSINEDGRVSVEVQDVTGDKRRVILKTPSAPSIMPVP